MGCIAFGFQLYEESKKTGKGCCEVLGDHYKQCCQGPKTYTEEEREALIIGENMIYITEDYYKKLYENRKLNLELLKTINVENKQLRDVMKSKLDSLVSQSEILNPKVIIGTGNSCNCPCYLYNLRLRKVCPKCDGKVEEEFENGYTVSQQWNESTKSYKEVKKYNETKICTGFRWNDKIDECDVKLSALWKYYDKTDPEKKVHYTINVEDPTTKEQKTEEFDVPCHYMMVDGQRFDFPYGLTMANFFRINSKYFFPKPQVNLAYVESGGLLYGHKICFWYEELREELGQSLGYYGYAWIHMVYIYTCNSCGHKYHIAKVSPFAFRDKSKDAK